MHAHREQCFSPTPTITLERIAPTSHGLFHAPDFLSCHSSSFQECHNVKCVRMGRLLQAICHATNKSLSCIVIERGGGVLKLARPKDGI